jgi:hypothetical protein
MNEIMKFYESFFDEESGNTREEGIKQLEASLREECNVYSKQAEDLRTNIKDLVGVVNDR